MGAATSRVGTPEQIRRWLADRAAVNAVAARDLEEYWGNPQRSLQAAFELVNLWGAIHGWPPPEDPIDMRDDLAVWDRFARLRRPYI